MSGKAGSGLGPERAGRQFEDQKANVCWAHQRQWDTERNFNRQIFQRNYILKFDCSDLSCDMRTLSCTK